MLSRWNATPARAVARALLIWAAAACLPAALLAAPPAPISPATDPFPGGFPSPGSAASAATALAARYLGDEPFDNPSIAPRRAASVSAMLLRVSRQDLRRENRQVDEQPVFFDAGGVWAAFGAGRVAFALYAHQPLLRLEDNAYLRGRGTDPLVVPVTIAGTVSMRELRAGAAVSFGGERLRVGVAGEWTRRDDRFEQTEDSSLPSAGARSVELSGGGLGVQAGAVARLRGAGGRGTIDVGLATRWIPALTVDVTATQEPPSGPRTTTGSKVERGAVVEGGASVRWATTDAFALLASGRARGEETWGGFGITRGPGSGWRIAGEYHDARDPWTIRLGVGADEERGVPEPRASVFGLGVGWQLETTKLEFGLLHRALRRPGEPNSSDDRVLVAVVQPF
jgi:hypothetical protein